jgi:hypothetical protein
MEKSIFKNEIKFLSLKRALPVFVGMLLVSTIFFSCVTPPVREECSRELLGTGIKNQEQLVKFFMNHKPDADKERVERLAEFYIEEAAIEGINSDVAFVQMCHETGFLGFGNLVLPEMNNFCGLGAMDAEHPGEQFPDEQTGVRAHIQHLQAYGTTEDVKLVKELVDPRYNWVHKTKFIEDIYGLAGTWATDPLYGQKIETVLINMGYF